VKKKNIIIPIDEIVVAVKGKLIGDATLRLKGLASLNDAEETDISFLGNSKYANQLEITGAGAVVVGKDVKIPDASGVSAYIVCENPNRAFATVIKLFAPPEVKYPVGIHQNAVVASTAEVGRYVSIGACAIIDENAVIGNNTVVLPGAYIGPETKVGSGCVIHANVSIRERCVIGDNVIIHSGTSIGSDGFGYEASPEGIVKIPQVGIVQIDDEVEIGANCTIDRARFGKTHIKSGVKIDNLVHIAHNVEVGESSMLIGQSGIAGSTKIGKGVIVAAQAGLNGHITIGDGAQIAGTAGVHKDVLSGAKVLGTPAESPRDFMARYMLPKTVDKLKKRIKELEDKFEQKG